MAMYKSWISKLAKDTPVLMSTNHNTPATIQSAASMYTQETSTKVTSGRHGLSDVNKCYFHFELSRELYMGYGKAVCVGR